MKQPAHHFASLESILLSNSSTVSSSTTTSLSPLEPALFTTIKFDLLELHSRVEAACEGIWDQESLEPDELETIQILDTLHYPLAISSIHRNIFVKRNFVKRKRGVEEELKLLFSWAITKDRFGGSRVYAVAKIIALELESVTSSDTTSSGSTRTDVEAAFINWIDNNMGGVRVGTTDGGVLKLLEELIRVGVISYSLYLQRMIARGETEDREGVVRCYLLFPYFLY